MENARWEIAKRPDDETSDDAAADFLCVEQATERTALIDVTEPGLTEDFRAKAAQDAKEISLDLKEIRENSARLLKHKNKQLTKTADRRCVVIVWEGSAQDPLFKVWLDQIKQIYLSHYPNIDVVYACADDAAAKVIQVLP